MNTKLEGAVLRFMLFKSRLPIADLNTCGDLGHRRHCADQNQNHNFYKNCGINSPFGFMNGWNLARWNVNY